MCSSLKQSCRLQRIRLLRWLAVVGEKGTGLECVNYIGMIYLMLLITSLLGVNISYTCPNMYGWQACQAPIIFGAFVAFNIFLNWYLFLRAVRFNKVSAHFSASAYAPDHPDPALPSLTTSDPYQQQRQSPATRLRTVAVDVEEPVYAKPLDMVQNGGIAVSPSTPASEHINQAVKFCSTCEQKVPQRCHHCPICKHCVLRKDHHCFITGACVGFGNQRYFIPFLFWGTIGAAYGTLWTGRLLTLYVWPILPYGWIDYVFPFAFFKWLIWRYVPFMVVMASLLFSAGWTGTYGALGFLFAQMYFVAKGVTMWEMSRRLPVEDNLSINQRFRSVFGPFWLLNFLFPLPYRNKLDSATLAALHSCYMKEL